MKKSILLTIIFLSSIIVGYAEDYVDVVYLKDSTVIEGYIIEQVPNKSLTIKKIDGELMTIDIEKVEKMTKKDKSKVSLKNKNYWELGINFGTPGGLNLLVGKWFSPVGIKVSGMNLGSMYGVQGNLMYKLSDNYSRCHSLGLIFGVSHIELEKTNGWNTETEIKDWQYYGAAYNLNWGGFWLEVGLTGGDGDFKAPQLAFQIGYTYRFIDY